MTKDSEIINNFVDEQRVKEIREKYAMAPTRLTRKQSQML